MEQAKFGAVLLAAGNSTRMGGSRSKVLEELGGRPALCRSLEVLDRCPLIGEICLVCREQDRADMLPLTSGLNTPVQVVPGGAQRQDSVERGVEALTGPWEYVAIHDGARPLVTERVLAAVCRDAMAYGAAAAAVPSKDTCKLADEAGFVAATPARDRLWAVQTPQAFSLALYREALGKARAAGQSYTDDCQLIEAAGGSVKLTMGDYRNIKLTTPEDLLAVRAYLGGEGGKKTVRIGYGYDVHRLVEGRKLILAGVEVPFEKGLLGHSDADVIAHAVADALLGAAALGDIGHLFPDTDPRYDGADSLKLLGEVCRLLREKGFSIGNIDATLLAQRPKIAPHISRMRENLAAACGIPVGQVSVKATTEERLGFTGREEGMAASAVCLLER